MADTTKGRAATVAGLSDRATTMAFALLAERIRSLPRDDRRDLLRLARELARTDDGEEVEGLLAAMREVLDQRPATAIPLEETVGAGRPGPGLQKWIDYIGGKIRAFREEAGLTQAELAERSGLPQSHISRLEGRKHSPSRVTVEKIAGALGRPVSDFDPSE